MSKLVVFLWLTVKCYSEVSRSSHRRCSIRTPFLQNTSRRLLLSFYKKILTNLKNVRQTGCFCRGAPSLMFARILNATLSESSPPLGLHKRILNSLCFLTLLIHTKHKIIRWNFGLTPRFYSLEGEVTHWVDKAKIVWLIVEQLPIKAGWWYAPLALGNFSWTNKQNYFSF